MELALVITLLVAGFLLTLAVHVVEPDERAVVYRLGRPHRTVGRGLLVTIPLVERVQRLPWDREDHRTLWVTELTGPSGTHRSLGVGVAFSLAGPDLDGDEHWLVRVLGPTGDASERYD